MIIYIGKDLNVIDIWFINHFLRQSTPNLTVKLFDIVKDKRYCGYNPVQICLNTIFTFCYQSICFIYYSFEKCIYISLDLYSD